MKILPLTVCFLLFIVGCSKEKEPKELSITNVVERKTVDINPDENTNNGSIKIDLNEDNINDIEFYTHSTSSLNFISLGVSAKTLSDYQIASTIDNYPLCSDSISNLNPASWVSSNNCLYCYSKVLIPPPGQVTESGLWKDKQDKFLTLHHVVNGENLYAWVKLTHTGGTGLIIKEYTYEYVQ